MRYALFLSIQHNSKGVGLVYMKTKTCIYTRAYFENRIVSASANVRKIRFRIEYLSQLKERMAGNTGALLGLYGNRWEDLMESCVIFGAQYLSPLGKIEKSLEELKSCYRSIERRISNERTELRLLMDGHLDTLVALEEQVIVELDDRIEQVQESLLVLTHMRDIDEGV